MTTPVYLNLEYNIQVLTIEMTGRKPLCIRVQITPVTSAFYFMPILCVLYSKTLKRSEVVICSYLLHGYDVILILILKLHRRTQLHFVLLYTV